MLSPRDAWHATLGQLQLQLNRTTFDTWLKGAELVSYDGGEFVVRVRHAYAKDWLEKHQHDLITRTLSNIFAQEAHVRFVIHTPGSGPKSSQSGPLWDYLRNQTRQGGESGPNSDRYEAQSDEEYDRPDYREWDPRFNPIPHRSLAERRDLFKTPLNKRLTFDTFVVGPSNRFAYAAAQAVAEAPGMIYNPLYIYGNPGLGKTHLAQAIGHSCEAAGKRVLYVTAEAFTNELVMAIRAQTTADFRERYRRAEVLIMDDIQFMAGKSSTEEEFYHTISTISSQGGQVVVVGNTLPRAIKKLDERLRTQLEWGLLADVQSPEEETRCAILETKAAEQQTFLPAQVAQTLARYNCDNVRELEGLLTQVLARATLTKKPLTVDLARQVMEKSAALTSPRGATPQLDDVLEATATYHQLSMDDLLGKRRTKALVHARHVAMYLAREETDASLPEIGQAVGGRNHTTVLYACQKIAACVSDDPDLRDAISEIRHQIHQRPLL